MTKHSFDPHQSQDRQRLMLALLVSLAILLGFYFIVDRPQQQAQLKAQQEKAAAQAAASGKAPSAILQKEPVARAEALAAGSRIPVDAPHIKGSIALKGARIDDIMLKDHYTAVERKENVALLSPAGTHEAYYVEGGWLDAGSKVNVPNADTLWSFAPSSPRAVKSGGEAVVLQWNNGAGLTFERSFSLDENYLFTVKQRVVNNSGAEVKLNAYNLAARHSLPKDYSGFFVLHEGPISVLNGKSEEPQYKDLMKGEKVEVDNATGWVGITDKYWLVALLPKPDAKFNGRLVAGKAGEGTVYQVDTVSSLVSVPAGSFAEDVSYVYAGVKNYDLIRGYEEKYGFNNLQQSIDFGMWYFITKPFYFVLHFLFGLIGNVGLGILLMTVVVRAAVFPLASKSFRSMAKMKLVAPQMKELQEKYKDDKAKLQMEIYELYKRENVNPFSGCWPMLIQIPIFFALYKVILISVDLRHTPFFGWIHDLSAPDPTTIFNLFGLIPWNPPQALMIGVWPLLFGLSMVLQMRVSPPPADPVQEKIQNYFPYFVMIMMAHFSVGLVIYWTWSNILGTIQQYYILNKMGGEKTSLIRGHASRRKKKTEESAK